jgi:hypothetical protein
VLAIVAALAEPGFEAIAMTGAGAAAAVDPALGADVGAGIVGSAMVSSPDLKPAITAGVGVAAGLRRAPRPRMPRFVATGGALVAGTELISGIAASPNVQGAGAAIRPGPSSDAIARFPRSALGAVSAGARVAKLNAGR